MSFNWLAIQVLRERILTNYNEKRKKSRVTSLWTLNILNEKINSTLAHFIAVKRIINKRKKKKKSNIFSHQQELTPDF